MSVGYRAEHARLEDFRIYQWMRPRLTDAIWCHAVALGSAEVAHIIHGVGATTNECEL